jgi:predicted lipoprotein with Yx(FWY)xxD motif
MKCKMLAAGGLIAAGVLIAAGCASSGGSGSGSAAQAGSMTRSAGSAGSGNTLRSAKVGGAMVLTNAKGFTLYWFVPDTASKSKCNGSCAVFWPPVKGPATLAAGIKGTLGTITRSDGSTQATFDGHPLYTYKGDSKPGVATGNGLNLSGGIWHEVTVSGAAPAPAPSMKSSSSSGGGYGY